MIPYRDRERIGKEEEKDFLEKVDEYNNYNLFAYNINDIYTIDYCLKNIKTNSIIAFVDIETRFNDIRKYSTVHVPMYTHNYVYTNNPKEGNKIKFFRQHLDNSFYIAWHYETKGGYLIKAENIFNSPEIKQPLSKNQISEWNIKILPCFDVPVKLCKKIKYKNVVKTILEELKQEKIYE